MSADPVERFKEKRRQRIADRAANAVNQFKWRRVARMLSRFDADGDEEGQNNKNRQPKGSSHGNTRLPFGLCIRFGIAIEPDWTPKDAWAALAGKGITAEGAYARLKRGEDPGTPDTPEGAEAPPEEPETPPEPPKEPKRTVTIRGKEYGKLAASYASWDKKQPWRLRAETEDETASHWERYAGVGFRTKQDMLMYLKEQGVEEFADPDTGELLNPAEMEMPEVLMKSSDGYGYYKDLSIGVRDGRYTIFGTDLDGKKWKEKDFPTLARAMEWLKGRGIEEDKVKMSPALKKKETSRLAWLSSDKKEWIEFDGEKWGNLKIFEHGYGGWILESEAEDGRKHRDSFPTKSDILMYLSSKGVEKATIGSGVGSQVINPKEYTPPPTVATIGGVGYTRLWYSFDYDGKLKLRGEDIDGKQRQIAYQPWKSTLAQFREKLQSDYGINESMIDIDDDTQKQIDRVVAEEAEKDRRRKEFEAKSVQIGAYRYMDPSIVRDYDGDFKLIGYDAEGNKRSITYGGDMYDTMSACQKYGLDPESLKMDDDVRKAYDKYQQDMREFDAKAVDYGGRRVADLALEYDHGRYMLRATDSRGRRRTVDEARKYEDIEDMLKQNGIDASTVGKSDEAAAAHSRYLRSKEALATGKYFTFGDDDDEAYTNLRAEKYPHGYEIFGTDVDGKERSVAVTSTWDEAVDRLEGTGAEEYKIKVGDKEYSRPAYGMHNISIRKNKGTGGFTVQASSKKFGNNAVMFEGTSEQECRDWLEKNGVDAGSVKTRGMNPNDDVPRTHTAKSLANFDAYRETEVEHCLTVMNLTSDEKKETADMLTGLFAGSAYRMRASSNVFESIFDTHFKNLLETGSSGGSDYKPGRRETHQKTFGGDYNVRPKDAEKYGFLGADDDYEAFTDSTGSHYGDVIFKFKKDAVGERTTYTFGDTLDRGRPLAGYAGEHPTIEGISGLTYPGSDDSDKVRNILEAYRKYKAGEISVGDIRKKIVRESYSSYIECQYHGDLTFADVQSVTMSKLSLDRIVSRIPKEKRQKMVSFFKEHGIIVQYEDNGVLRDGLPKFEE